jgi:hypothetical protein
VIDRRKREDKKKKDEKWKERKTDKHRKSICHHVRPCSVLRELGLAGAATGLVARRPLHTVCNAEMYRRQIPSGNVSHVYSGDVRDRISAGTPTILTEFFHGFPQSLHIPLFLHPFPYTFIIIIIIIH